MAFDLKSVTRNKRLANPRLFLYGGPGAGKTTFAAGAPDPIFIITEQGLGNLDVDHFPLAESYQDVVDAIETLYTTEHEYKTVVLDSVGWTEQLIYRAVEASGKDLSYGKDAILAAEMMLHILNGLDALRNDKAMSCILLGHSQVTAFASPEHEPFDRYSPKLQKRIAAMIVEWVDAVLYTSPFKTTVKKEGAGLKETKRGITVGNAERMAYTTETPAYVAKNRFSLPPSFPLSWESFAAQIAA